MRMLKSLSRRGVPLAAIAAVCGLVAGAANAAELPRDWSGVWGAYVEPGQSPFGRRALDLPFTPEGKKRVDAYRSLVAAGSDTPGAHCLGSGMPESMMFSGGYPMEIIQRPQQITIVYEAHTEIRRLYLGDKVLPEVDRVPGRNGYSSARWEGDTLIVESTSLREQEDQMYPHSDQARIEERYHQETDGSGTRVLVADMTLTDPLFYTQPVTAKKKWAFEPKGVLLAYECNEEAWLDHLEKLKQKQAAARKAKK
jgi:hypothetical protein